MIRIVHDNDKGQRIEFWIDQSNGDLVINGQDETITIPRFEGNEILDKLDGLRRKYIVNNSPHKFESFEYRWQLMKLRVNERIEKMKR